MRYRTRTTPLPSESLFQGGFTATSSTTPPHVGEVYVAGQWWGYPFSGAATAGARAGGLRTVTFTGLSEGTWFTDEPKGWGRENYASHLRTILEYYPYGFVIKKTPTGRDYWGADGQICKPPNAGAFTLQTVSQSERDSNTSEAQSTLIPSFDPVISGLNSIYELKDFRNIGKLLARAGDRIANTASAIEGYIKSWKGNPVLAAAELNLINEFAVKPTVSDVAAISVSLGNASSALERFNARGKVISTKHFSKEAVMSLSYTDSTVAPYYRTYVRTRYVFHAHAELTYRHLVEGGIDLFLQRWGLKLTPSVIWNGIPFSFLADYVCNVGGMMEQLSRNTVTEYTISGYTESYKVYTEHLVCFRGKSTATPYGELIWEAGGVGDHGFDVPDNMIPVAYSSKEHYVRTPFVQPPLRYGCMAPRFNPAKLQQLVNIGSLIVSIGIRAGRRSGKLRAALRRAVLGRRLVIGNRSSKR